MLISLLVVGGVLHRVLPTTDRKAQLRRAQHLVQDNWVATATRKALQDIQPALLGWQFCPASSVPELPLGGGGPDPRCAPRPDGRDETRAMPRPVAEASS